MRKSKNRYFNHIFISPGDAPEAITLNVVRMESAHLTITVSEIQRDICERIVILSYPLHSSEYRHPLWDGKIRMVSLPDGEKISKICLFVLTWSTNVMDRRTDRQTLHDSKDRACIASRGKNLIRSVQWSFPLCIGLYTWHCKAVWYSTQAWKQTSGDL